MPTIKGKIERMGPFGIFINNVWYNHNNNQEIINQIKTLSKGETVEIAHNNKIIQKITTNNNPEVKEEKVTNPPISSQTLIIRQSCIKSACDTYNCDKTTPIADDIGNILNIANELEKWVLRS